MLKKMCPKSSWEKQLVSKVWMRKMLQHSIAADCKVPLMNSLSPRANCHRNQITTLMASRMTTAEWARLYFCVVHVVTVIDTHAHILYCAPLKSTVLPARPKRTKGT